MHTSSLDLHGIKHANVPSLLDSFLWNNMRINKTSVEVITGKSDVMKNIVKGIAEEYGLRVEECITNDGKLIINLF